MKRLASLFLLAVCAVGFVGTCWFFILEAHDNFQGWRLRGANRQTTFRTLLRRAGMTDRSAAALDITNPPPSLLLLSLTIVAGVTLVALERQRSRRQAERAVNGTAVAYAVAPPGVTSCTGCRKAFDDSAYLNDVPGTGYLCSECTMELLAGK